MNRNDQLDEEIRKQYAEDEAEQGIVGCNVIKSTIGC